MAVAIEKIEGKENNRKIGDELGRRIADVHSFLKLFKVAPAALVEYGNFAVQDSLCGRNGLGKVVKFRILRGNVIPRTRSKFEFSMLDESEGPYAVPFDFEKPVGIRKWMIGKSGKHGAKFRRHGGLTGILQLGGV